MKLPFTVEQFIQVFRDYNWSVFPLQVLFNLLAVVAIVFSVKKIATADRIVNSILSFFWFWMGIVYHLIFFAAINKAAYLFAALFIAQGLLLFYYGVIRGSLTYKFKRDGSGLTGAALTAFAIIVYPALGYLSGHTYPASPTFGVPCPT